MFSRFTFAAIISAIILFSSVIYTVAQQPINKAEKSILYTDTAEYSIKFVCGIIRDNMQLSDREYHTVINIHNPNTKEVELEWEVSHDGRISEFMDVMLKPEQTMEIDCRAIEELLEIKGFTEGFVIIHQPLGLQFQKLDVSPIYAIRDNGQ